MPLYEYRCNNCGEEFEGFRTIAERYNIACPKCNTPRPEILLGGNRQQVRLFPEGWFEHIAPEPIYISSRRQLREECEKHNCYSKYLDGYFGKKF